MTEEETPNLLALHPKKLSDEEYSAYEAEFEKVLNDPLCRNIALSGSYGAGKSSVIEKVKERQQAKDEKWISISLATFCEANTEDGGEGEATQNAIEAGILRQMIHKIGTSNAPKSGLHELRDRGRFKDAITSVAILVFVILTPYLAHVSAELLSLRFAPVPTCALVIWLFIAGYCLYHLVRTSAISNMVKRIKVFEAELEVTPSDSTSPYERCVDEIVYLLNASEIDAVVFEDLDRFNSIDIFEKMRSLNALANDSRVSAAKKSQAAKPLRFFYLVRDGLFADPRDRTKFFDFIIPVIPYTDPNNASDIMRSALAGVGLSVDEGFLFQLSIYIDDPRIIHDIADEAYHYKKTLFKERSFNDGDSERLIALLAYKALFPKDFELLQVGRGYLHEVLNGKHRLITDLEQDFKDERDELLAELDIIKQQLKVTEDELICMYGAPAMSKVSQYLRHIYANNSDPHSFIEAARNNSQASTELKSIEDKLRQNNRYVARRREVRRDSNRRSNVIRTRLTRLDARLETLHAMSLKQLIDESQSADTLFVIDRSNLERAEDFEELLMGDVLSSPHFSMLRFLVSSGYIDESYRRYISNFYSDLLCAEDDDFLSVIRQAKPVDLAYKPKEPVEIIRRIDKGVFARKNIRNPWLISALFESGSDDKISVFMSSIKQPEGIRYLAQFIASEQFTPAVFAPMLQYLDGDPVAELLSDEGISADDKRCFCKRYLINGEDCDNVFLKYVNSDSHFLEEDSRFSDKEIEDGLLRIDYRTEAIDFSCASKTLLDYVYDNHLFMPTPLIVDGYLSLKYGVHDALNRGTLITEALKLSDDPIKDAVSENMERFVSGVVNKPKAKLEDEQQIVVAVLNERNIQTGTIEQYIAALSNVEVEDVAQVKSPEYQDMLLENRLVKCNADNVILFYQKADNAISDNLAKLIEAKGAPTGLNAPKCREANVDEADVVGKLIEHKTIPIDTKRTILSECGFIFSTFNIDGLDDETVHAMIDTKAIDMNGEMLDEFRTYKPDLIIDYILTDVDGFLAMAKADPNVVPEMTIERNEAEGLLKASIDVSKKLDILSCFDGTTPLDEGYEDAVNAAIALKHLEPDDIASLPLYYEKASGSDKDQFAKAFANSSDAVISNNVEFGWSLLYDALRHLKNKRARALRLIAWYSEQYCNEGDRDRLLSCFVSADLPEYIKLLRGSQSMIPKSSEDDAMLSRLNELGMCGRVSPDVNAGRPRKVYPKGHRRTKKT